MTDRFLPLVLPCALTAVPPHLMISPAVSHLMPPHLRSHRSSTPSDLIWAWLWQACGNNHTAVVDLLLRNLKWVVNTNAQDMHGSTALFAATGKGNTEVVRMLLNHNADPADPNLLYLYHDRKLGPTSLTALDLAQVANLVHGGACTSKHLHEDLHARAYILVNTYLGMQTLIHVVHTPDGAGSCAASSPLPLGGESEPQARHCGFAAGARRSKRLLAESLTTVSIVVYPTLFCRSSSASHYLCTLHSPTP